MPFPVKLKQAFEREYGTSLSNLSSQKRAKLITWSKRSKLSEKMTGRGYVHLHREKGIDAQQLDRNTRDLIKSW